MNERIRELAIEARLITVDGITRYALDNEFEQRFTELIVRECCKEISYVSVGHEDPVFAYAYIDHLRNTFGVEKC